ncbi:unnamed protein product, partial [Tilletia laevis]
GGLPGPPSGGLGLGGGLTGAAGAGGSRWGRSSVGGSSPPHPHGAAPMRQWGVKRDPHASSSRSPPLNRSPVFPPPPSMRSQADHDDARFPAPHPQQQPPPSQRSPPPPHHHQARARSPTPSPPSFVSSSAARRASFVSGPPPTASLQAAAAAAARADLHPDAASSNPVFSSVGPAAATAVAGAGVVHANIQSPVTTSMAEHYSFGDRADSEELEQEQEQEAAAAAAVEPVSKSDLQEEAKVGGEEPVDAGEQEKQGLVPVEADSREREGAEAQTPEKAEEDGLANTVEEERPEAPETLESPMQVQPEPEARPPATDDEMSSAPQVESMPDPTPTPAPALAQDTPMDVDDAPSADAQSSVLPAGSSSEDIAAPRPAAAEPEEIALDKAEDAPRESPESQAGLEAEVPVSKDEVAAVEAADARPLASEAGDAPEDVDAQPSNEMVSEPQLEEEEVSTPSQQQQATQAMDLDPPSPIVHREPEPEPAPIALDPQPERKRSPSPRAAVPEPVSPLFNLAEAAISLLEENSKASSAVAESSTSLAAEARGSVQAVENAMLSVARTQGAEELKAPAAVAHEEDTERIEMPSLGITFSAQDRPREDSSSMDTSASHMLAAVGQEEEEEAEEADVDVSAAMESELSLVAPSSSTPPPPIVLELTEEERERRMRSSIVRLGRELESWQADDYDLVHRNKRTAKEQRTRLLPSGVPVVSSTRREVDLWLVESDDPARKADQQAYFAQLQDDVQAYIVKERAALTAKEERLRTEYLSIDRSWQQHCARLQRIEERRETREAIPGSSSTFSSTLLGQSQQMLPNLGSIQRRPAMHLHMHTNPLSAGGMNGMSSSTAMPEDYVSMPLSARPNRRGGTSAYPAFGDAVRSEAEFLEILATLENADMQDPNARAARTTATVPDLILSTDGEPMMSGYDDDNGYVADPVAFFFDEFDPDVWTEEEKAVFERKYALWPKQFGRIAAGMPGKTRAQCVRYYYQNKKQPGSNFKAIAAARSRERKRKNRVKPKKAKGSALMADLKIDDLGDDDDPTESRGEFADLDMVDGTAVAEGQDGSDPVAPLSPPPAKKRRKEDPSAIDGFSSKKSKTKGRKSKGEKKSKSKGGGAPSPSASSSDAVPPPVVRTPLVANAPPLAPIGEHEESELAAAEMLNALAGIGQSPVTNTSLSLAAVDDGKGSKKKRKSGKSESVGPEGSSDPVGAMATSVAGGLLSSSNSKRPRQSTSSYWSIDEKNEFLRSLAANGKEWNVVASTLQTKSAAQARNYYMRNADDPDFVEACKLGERNVKLDPSMREAAASAFHNKRIAEGAPVGVGTGRVQLPPMSSAPTSEANEEGLSSMAPTAHRGFQIMSLLNEQPSRPDSRSSSAPFSSQAGRDEFAEAQDGAASSRRGPSSTDGDDTDEEEYAARQSSAAHGTYPLHPPIGVENAYLRQDVYGSYLPRQSTAGGSQVSASPVYGTAPPLPSRVTASGYGHSISHLAARDAMPPPSVARRYDAHSPVIVSTHAGHLQADDGERSEYGGQGSTPHGPPSPDLERHQALYGERPAHPPWTASASGRTTSEARSSSVRYTPAPLSRGYPIHGAPQSPPPARALHSASPVAALSSSAPSHAAGSSMQPPLSRPGYVAYRSTSASVTPSYSSNPHGHAAAAAAESSEISHAHAGISRMTSRSPEQAPVHRASQSPAYQPLGHAHGHSHSHIAQQQQQHLHQHHGPPSHAHSQSHASSLQHPAYSSPTVGSYPPAPVRSSSLGRGASASIGAPPSLRPGTSSSTTSTGLSVSNASGVSSAYALSASRAATTLPSLPSFHTLGAPTSRFLSSARPSTATSLETAGGARVAPTVELELAGRDAPAANASAAVLLDPSPSAFVSFVFFFFFAPSRTWTATTTT